MFKLTECRGRVPPYRLCEPRDSFPHGPVLADPFSCPVDVVGTDWLDRICLEESIKYSMERKTFGKRLIDQPVIREKIGHMAQQIEATQSLIELMAYQGKMMSHLEALQTLGASVALLKSQSTRYLSSPQEASFLPPCLVPPPVVLMDILELWNIVLVKLLKSLEENPLP